MLAYSCMCDVILYSHACNSDKIVPHELNRQIQSASTLPFHASHCVSTGPGMGYAVGCGHKFYRSKLTSLRLIPSPTMHTCSLKHMYAHMARSVLPGARLHAKHSHCLCRGAMLALPSAWLLSESDAGDTLRSFNKLWGVQYRIVAVSGDVGWWRAYWYLYRYILLRWFSRSDSQCLDHLCPPVSHNRLDA
jgi:hypothetical protein